MRQKILMLLIAALTVATTAIAGHGEGGEEGEKVKHRYRVRVVDEDAPGDVIFIGEDERPVIAPLLHRGGFLGVKLTDLSPDLRQHFGVGAEQGVMVSAVVDDAPAQQAGVQVGDIILAVDGEPIASSIELTRKVRSSEAGDALTLDISRDGDRRQVTATLAESKRPRIDIGRHLVVAPHAPEQLLKLEELRALKELRIPDIEKINEQLEHIQLPRLEELEALKHIDVQIDEEQLERALAEIEAKLQSREWQDKIQAMVEERMNLQEKLEEMEVRLQEMAERLAEIED